MTGWLRSRPIAAALVALTGACTAPPQVSNAYSPLFAPAGEPICSSAEDLPCQVSLISLIANPAKYSGKHIQAIGFATFEFEGNALYLSREAAQVGDTSSAIWIDVEGITVSHPEKLGGRYVLIAGTFDAENRGHLGMFAGALKSIVRLQQVKQ